MPTCAGITSARQQHAEEAVAPGEAQLGERVAGHAR